MPTRPHLAVLLDDFRRFGHQTAIVQYTGNRRKATSYQEIATLAERFAALLAARNFQVGDRLILWAQNSAEWVAAFYGCILRGIIAVPLDAYGTPDFAARVASDVRPSLIVGDATLLQTLPNDWPRLSFEDWPTTLPPTVTADQAIPTLSHDTPLQILFTSGTTGEPKGIVHTHGNILASFEPIRNAAQPYMRYERIVHPLRFLHTLPLSHVFGQMMGLWVPSIFAAEVHFESRLTAPRLIETIRRERISVLAGVPRVLALLKTNLETEHPNLTARLAAAQGISAQKRWWRFRDIHSLFGFKFWAFVTGGGALPAPIEHFWNALGFVLVQGYGMTETSALITLNHPFKVARGTMGKPLPGRDVKIQPDGEVLVRGPMISPATWSGGALQQRTDEWLATGDLAEAQPTGELRFLGRKSETIVTATGVNLHPEDLEAAFEQEPEVAACAVVPIEAPTGPEPCAVLALRTTPDHAPAILQRANTRLAEFQRIRRWAIWPEPDLPRTSTGKIKRAAVATWLTSREANNGSAATSPSALPSTDWLLTLITQITGEGLPAELPPNPEAQSPEAKDQDLRLAEDLRLDSLGRVQLQDALEQRLGTPLPQDQFDHAETLNQLRQLLIHSGNESLEPIQPLPSNDTPSTEISTATTPPRRSEATPPPEPRTSPAATHYLYPHWPWSLPIRWIRSAFVEFVAQPLVWFLAAPLVPPTTPHPAKAPQSPAPQPAEPLLIIANHVTAYDLPLLLYALPRPIRLRTAVAMSGEMLEDFRHARNQHPRWLNPLGPPTWLLLTALFNVFPLPRLRDFQRSFAHVGNALDRGFHVVVFPEGTRSPEGTLAPFRPGIGLLVKQSSAAVLPMAIQGLGELKTRRRRWFRSGALHVRTGQPIRFAPDDSEAAITARLHAEVETLLAKNQP
ncbi:AMP-binding protein [Tunturiibacter gelidoferens]|uniref:Long-chain acyl-CoA synthetase n=1 Tax=Tunturiibacter gelidiferens TaxID=3069689 RepID=A0ACC5P2N7_9BACT|nr:AMP-binding protein [Edaphobacter lichenicola]MBB5341123.1 long-chain acyl-CoA synthetase [Edaphobacter lichenicola]